MDGETRLLEMGDRVYVVDGARKRIVARQTVTRVTETQALCLCGNPPNEVRYRRKVINGQVSLVGGRDSFFSLSCYLETPALFDGLLRQRTIENLRSIAWDHLTTELLKQILAMAETGLAATKRLQGAK